MNAWWEGLPAAQTTVTCGERPHRLRWERGGLRALDHEDLDADQALAARVGARCICGEIGDAWVRHVANLRVLTLASRGAVDPLRISAGSTPWGPPTPLSMGPERGYVFGGGAPGSPDRDLDDPAPLLGLGGGLPARLVATVAHHWRDRTDAGEPERRAALYGRLLPTLRAWLNHPWLQLELDLVTSDAPRTIALEADTIHVALPFAWLSDVWVRDIAVIAGRLTLAAAPSPDGSRWRLTTITPELTATSTAEVALPG